MFECGLADGIGGDAAAFGFIFEDGADVLECVVVVGECEVLEDGAAGGAAFRGVIGAQFEVNHNESDESGGVGGCSEDRGGFVAECLIAVFSGCGRGLEGGGVLEGEVEDGEADERSGAREEVGHLRGVLRGACGVSNWSGRGVAFELRA
ncbi:MAG: hypothetical protein RL215_2029 [Planctomycetota bacterium]